MCTHDTLERDQSFTPALICRMYPNKATIAEIWQQSELPEYITYSPYICKECGKRYIVLQAVVE